MDLWESAASSNIFLVSGFSCSQPAVGNVTAKLTFPHFVPHFQRGLGGAIEVEETDVGKISEGGNIACALSACEHVIGCESKSLCFRDSVVRLSTCGKKLLKCLEEF